MVSGCIAAVKFHHLANIPNELRGKGSSIISLQINGRSVVKYPMAKEILCEFPCGNTSYGYFPDHFGERIGYVEVLATSLGSDELFQYVDAH